mmetsp:Transcript_28285/g.88141  ORF Transcript_28285/g.88141 Transcript_28285/m.88141 type:complete len:302 (-) Transcript_28285:342-1247(-)
MARPVPLQDRRARRRHRGRQGNRREHPEQRLRRRAVRPGPPHGLHGPAAAHGPDYVPELQRRGHAQQSHLGRAARCARGRQRLGRGGGRGPGLRTPGAGSTAARKAGRGHARPASARGRPALPPHGPPRQGRRPQPQRVRPHRADAGGAGEVRPQRRGRGLLVRHQRRRGRGGGRGARPAAGGLQPHAVGQARRGRALRRPRPQRAVHAEAAAPHHARGGGEAEQARPLLQQGLRDERPGPAVPVVLDVLDQDGGRARSVPGGRLPLQRRGAPGGRQGLHARLRSGHRGRAEVPHLPPPGP